MSEETPKPADSTISPSAYLSLEYTLRFIVREALLHHMTRHGLAQNELLSNGMHSSFGCFCECNFEDCG